MESGNLPLSPHACLISSSLVPSASEPVLDKFTTRGSFRPQLPRRRGRSVAAVIITMIPNVANDTIRSWNELLDRTTLIGQLDTDERTNDWITKSRHFFVLLNFCLEYLVTEEFSSSCRQLDASLVGLAGSELKSWEYTDAFLYPRICLPNCVSWCTLRQQQQLESTGWINKQVVTQVVFRKSGWTKSLWHSVRLLVGAESPKGNSLQYRCVHVWIRVRVFQFKCANYAISCCCYFSCQVVYRVCVFVSAEGRKEGRKYPNRRQNTVNIVSSAKCLRGLCVGVLKVLDKLIVNSCPFWLLLFLFKG